MEKLVVALGLCSCLAMCSVYGTLEPQNGANQWLYGVTNGKVREKVTQLKFYAQDVLAGPNATVTTVAQGPETNKSSTGFGTVAVVDDLLTETPEPQSKAVGRAQGIVSFSSEDELAVLMAINFVFTSGKLRGSSLTMLGRNPIVHPLREIPIVGGTGMFRLARGFVNTKTYQINSNVKLKFRHGHDESYWQRDQTLYGTFRSSIIS